MLLENLLRNEDGRTVTADDIRAMAGWLTARKSDREIAFRPARVLMQDFTGVPAVVDLAAMRDATKKLGVSPKKINPLVPVDLVIDHSVMVDAFGNGMAFKFNVEREYERNKERYEFLRWGSGAFDNFRVVPPDTRLTLQQRARAQRMLQAFDGSRDGATQQDIAQVIFRTGHVNRDEWQASSARHAVMSLLRDARALIAGGYRKLLRHRRQS